MSHSLIQESGSPLVQGQLLKNLQAGKYLQKIAEKSGVQLDLGLVCGYVLKTGDQNNA